MKSIKLTITYKSGETLDQIVHYVHFADNAIYFQLKKQVNFTFGDSVAPVKIPLDIIDKIDITESEQTFNH